MSTVCASLRSFPFLFRPTFQPISILPPHSSLFSYALVVLEDCTQTPLHRLYTHNPSLCKAKHLGKLLAYPLNPLTQTHYHEFCIIYASASTLSRAYASGRYHCQHLYLCWRRVFSSSQFEKWRQKMSPKIHKRKRWYEQASHNHVTCTFILQLQAYIPLQS